MTSHSPDSVYSGAIGPTLKTIGKIASTAMMGSTGRIHTAGQLLNMGLQAF